MQWFVVSMFYAEIHVSCAWTGVLMDVSMQVECGDHVVFAQRHVAEHKVMFTEHPPHGDLVEMVDQISLDHVVVTKNQTFTTMKLADHPASRRVTHSNITQMVDPISRFDAFIPSGHHAVVHLLHAVKRPYLVASIVGKIEKVGMSKMRIADEPNVFDWIRNDLHLALRDATDIRPSRAAGSAFDQTHMLR